MSDSFREQNFPFGFVICDEISVRFYHGLIFLCFYHILEPTPFLILAYILQDQFTSTGVPVFLSAFEITRKPPTTTPPNRTKHELFGCTIYFVPIFAHSWNNLASALYERYDCWLGRSHLSRYHISNMPDSYTVVIVRYMSWNAPTVLLHFGLLRFYYCASRI